MKDEVSEKIARTFNARALWLSGEVGDPAVPENESGEPYSSLDLPKKRRTKPMLTTIDPDGDDSARIHELCHTLTRLLRAALRKGKLSYAVDVFATFERRLSKTLALDVSHDLAALRRVEHCLFTTEQFSSDPGSADVRWRLMSPTAILKLSDSSLDAPEYRNAFATDFEEVASLVGDLIRRG